MDTQDARDLLLLAVAASLDQLLANRRQNQGLRDTRDALLRASFDFAESLKSRMEQDRNALAPFHPAA